MNRKWTGINRRLGSTPHRAAKHSVPVEPQETAEMDSGSALVFLAMILFACRGVTTAATGTHWDFAATGIHWDFQHQDQWKNIPGASCGGNRQSPININTWKVIPQWHSWLFFNDAWENKITVNKTNNGHSITCWPENLHATVTTSKGTYKLLQFHVHWGRNRREGSEHLVNGRAYSAEFHFVTEKLTGSASDGDHYSVLGVFAVEDPTAPIIPGCLWDKMMPVTKFNGHERVTYVPFYELFPDDLSYYHYEGSLTTPPCSETVQWFVMKKCIRVPSAYLRALRQVKDENGHNLLYNFRDTQPLNGRTVYYTKD